MIIQEIVKFQKIWNCVYFILFKNDQLFIVNFFFESYIYIIFFFKKVDYYLVFIFYFDFFLKNFFIEIKKIYVVKEF